jgi:hypothetical protein
MYNLKPLLRVPLFQSMDAIDTMVEWKKKKARNAHDELIPMKGRSNRVSHVLVIF